MLSIRAADYAWRPSKTAPPCSKIIGSLNAEMAVQSQKMDAIVCPHFDIALGTQGAIPTFSAHSKCD